MLCCRNTSSRGFPDQLPAIGTGSWNSIAKSSLRLISMRASGARGTRPAGVWRPRIDDRTASSRPSPSRSPGESRSRGFETPCAASSDAAPGGPSVQAPNGSFTAW